MKEKVFELLRHLHRNSEPVYRGTRAIAPTSNGYTLSEWVSETLIEAKAADPKQIETPYWFILYGGVFSIATAIYFLNDRYKTSATGRAKEILNLCTEVLEESFLLTLQVQAIFAPEGLLTPFLILGGLSLAYLARTMALHHFDHLPRGLQLLTHYGNDLVFNPIQFSILTFGLLQNWVIDEFEATSPTASELAIYSASGAFAATYLALGVEKYLECSQKLSHKNQDKYRDSLFRVADFIQSNIFLTRFVANTVVTIIGYLIASCDDKCKDNAGTVAFALATLLSVVVGLARVFHLEENKPHRMSHHAPVAQDRRDHDNDPLLTAAEEGNTPQGYGSMVVNNPLASQLFHFEDNGSLSVSSDTASFYSAGSESDASDDSLMLRGLSQ